jgi:hypothetical protein
MDDSINFLDDRANRQTVGGALFFLGFLIFLHATQTSTFNLELVILSLIVVGSGVWLIIGMKNEVAAGAVLGLVAFWIATRLSGTGGTRMLNCADCNIFSSGFPWRFSFIGGFAGYQFYFTRFLADLLIFLLPGIGVGRFVNKFINRSSQQAAKN